MIHWLSRRGSRSFIKRPCFLLANGHRPTEHAQFMASAERSCYNMLEWSLCRHLKGICLSCGFSLGAWPCSTRRSLRLQQHIPASYLSRVSARPAAGNPAVLVHCYDCERHIFPQALPAPAACLVSPAYCLMLGLTIVEYVLEISLQTGWKSKV